MEGNSTPSLIFCSILRAQAEVFLAYLHLLAKLLVIEEQVSQWYRYSLPPPPHQAQAAGIVSRREPCTPFDDEERYPVVWTAAA